MEITISTGLKRRYFLYTCRLCKVDTKTLINPLDPASTPTPKCHLCGTDSRRHMAYRGVCDE